MFVAWVLGACREPSPPFGPGSLVLNEVSSLNLTGFVDPDSGECPEYDDYVELFHAGRGTVHLEEWSVEDDGGVPFALPALDLSPGERVLLIADDDDAPFHLPFGVSQYGERLRLWHGSALADTVQVPALKPDTAWGRWGDGGRWRGALPTPDAPNERPPDDPCFLPQPGFDDHTFACLATRAGFDAASDGRAGTRVVKFEVLGFPAVEGLEVVFLDSRFYQLHDEWYLFRMMNGVGVRGEDVFQPFDGPGFPDVASLYSWARNQDLPSLFPSNFLTWTDTGRLTSSRFYELALSRPRRIGAGTLVHFDQDLAGNERWAFELEHSDELRYDELVAFFEVLDRNLAPAAGGGVVDWLVRSSHQESVVADMEARSLPYADRIVRYDELSAPGTVEVYRGGTVAGRVRMVRAGTDDLADARSTDVLVVEEIPDWLPPCAGFVTTVPQTPLAHVALLAESRGIPNLSVTGLSNDPQWDAWGRVKRPVVLRATVPDGLEVRELTDEEWLTWQLLQDPAIGELTAVDGSAAPWVLDLADVPVEQMTTLRGVLGGKSAGYLALLHTDGVEAPSPVLGITIRGYQAHLAPLARTVSAVLADPAFAVPGDEQVRYLVLEGGAAFDERYPTSAATRENWLAEHAGSTLGALAEAEGLRGAVAEAPLPAAVEREVLDVVRAAYADLAPEQGLRFRSSSNVEDVEGFVGAGLYTSNTGYLDPAEGDSLADALRATFASYWSAEAFEERHAVGLTHANGAMGVTVHPNFPDELELANGVLHLVRLPDGGTELVVNSQLGSLSVTNPPVDTCRVILPEVSVVRDGGVIERVQASTERPEGQVLTDADLLDLWGQVVPVLDTWLRVDNQDTDDARDRAVLTLDLEYRKVDVGWPARADGIELPSRLVVKQCRSLEPAPAGLPEEVEALPVPKDVLGRAKGVEERECMLPEGDVVVTLLTTDPALPPDLGYTVVPFVAAVEVGGEVLDWTDLTEVVGTGRDDLEVTFSAEVAARVGIAGFSLRAASDCVDRTLWASPVTYLDGLL
jgi:hypothetical protein